MGIELNNIDGYQIERDHSRKGKKRHKGGASGGEREGARKEIEAELQEATIAEDVQEEEVTVPVKDEVIEEASALKEVLAAEREQRTALEARMEKMEARLAEAEAEVRAAKATPKTDVKGDALGLVTLQAQAAAELEAHEQRAVLDTWILESQLRVEEEERAQEQLASTASILELHQPREPMDDRLRTARAQVETAESRAADQSRKVKALTRELEEARAEQQRTAARLQEIESRLNQADAQASVAVAPAVEDVELAPATQDAPVLEEEPATSDALDSSVIDSPFEGPDDSLDVAVAADVAEEEEAVLSAALSGWGMDEDTDMDGGVVEDLLVQEELPKETETARSEPEVTTEAATSVVEEISLTDELSSWGSEDTEKETVSAAEAPVVEELSLADELTAWGADDSEDDVETAEDFSPEAEEEALSSTDLLEEITNDDGGEEVEDDAPMTIVAEASDGVESMADALSNWGNMEADAKSAPSEQVEEEQAPESSKERVRADDGKEAMLDALMRFMGPK